MKQHLSDFCHVICKMVRLQNFQVKVSIFNLTALHLNLLTKFWVWFKIICSIVKLNQNFAELLRKMMVLLNAA